MVPVEVRQQPHVSFTQLDQYLRCPLRYRFLYIDRLEPDFVPAARAFGSGIHAAAAVFFRGVGQGERPTVEDVQGYLRFVRRELSSAENVPTAKPGEKADPKTVTPQATSTFVASFLDSLTTRRCGPQVRAATSSFSAASAEP